MLQRTLPDKDVKAKEEPEVTAKVPERRKSAFKGELADKDAVVRRRIGF